MSTFRIDQQGGGDFSTIAQALRHCLLAQEKAPVLRLGPGVWREKLTLRIPGLTLEGAGAEKTILVWGDGALMPRRCRGAPGHLPHRHGAGARPGRYPAQPHRAQRRRPRGPGGPGPVALYLAGTGAMWRAAPWRPSRIP